MKHIQYIDKNITEIVLFAQNKLRNKKGKHQWSPYFSRSRALVSYYHITLTQLRTDSDQLNRLNCLKNMLKNDV